MAERTSVLPEQEDQFTSFLRDVYSSTPEEDAQFQRFASGENAPQLPTAPGNLQEVFSAGIESGVQGLAADLEYFKALGNTLMGDEQAAALNIQEARLREEFAAAPVEGLDTFKQFLDQPTFGGFIEQATKSFGQVLPSAALSIAGAGTGAITAAVGRGVLNQVNKQVAKRIIKDSVERTANGVADPVEQQIAELAYGSLADPVEQQIAELAYGSLRTAAKRGAIGGAFAAEYAPMSGSNLSEALEAGQPLDQANALRAAAIGIPQAAIGVGSEYALLKLIGEQATKRAAVEGGVFANFAKRLGTGALQGGAIEATTEVAQEGISVLNRADLDPLFTAEDAKMRLAEAAFAGFFGGAAPGGAGGAIGGTLDAVSSMKPGQGVLTNVGNIVEKAKGFLETARGQRVDQQINNEQFGDVAAGLTTPESEGDIDAQLRAMVDPSSGKKAVWIAGAAPKFNAPQNRVKTASINGTLAYSAFVPGRGTIVSTNEDVVREVIAAGASDKALQIALGYSAVKDYSAPGDIVVQALDRNGRVISEEVTSPEGVSAAFEAARNLMPEGGSIQQTTVEKALEDRKRRFESEQRVEVRDIDLSDEQTDETDADQVEMFGQGVQAVEGQRTVVRAYGRKTDPNRVFDNTQSARASYDTVFGETNWADPRFASMTEAMLNAAVNEQRSNPDSAVSIEDTPDGGYQIVRDDFGDLFRSIDTAGNEVRLNLPEFLRSAIQRARRSKYAQNSRVTIVGPDGKKSAVNLVDLTAAGQRLLEGREGSGFQLRQDPRTGATYVSPEAAARAGLLEVLGDLAVEGYDVQIDGQSLFPGFQLTPDRNQAAAGRIPARLGNVTAAVIGGRQRSLNDLLNPVQEPVMTAEERQAALAAEPLGPPRDDVSDGRTETERMIESSVTGGELLTPMNIDTPRSAIDLRAGRAPTTVSPLAERRSAQERISNAINSMVGDIVRDLFDSLKFADPPHIFTFAELTAMSDDQLLQLFGGALNPVREAIASMQNSSTKRGMHISGQFGKIIIFRESGNVLQDALVIAHEIGHSLYKEERNKALENSAIRKRLFRAYQSSPSFKDLKDKYGFDLGFEEWFSDQVALWANKRYRSRQKADSLVKKFFKDFAARLESLWKQTSESFRKRFGGRLGAVNEDFETFMDAVLESRKSQVKENGLSFTERAFVYELNDLNIANGGAARAAHWQSKISQLKKSPYVKPILRLVSTADGILRMYAGNEIADMFYVRAQDPTGKGRLGFVPQSARTFDLYKNRLDTELGSFDDPALDAEFDKAASDTPTAQLTGKALAIRQFLEDFYSEYVSPSKTKIGFQRDYFPRLLDLVAISNEMTRKHLSI